MLPRALNKVCEEQRGLVLVTGPTGSGKSTTLAAMIDHINATRTEPHHHHRGPHRVPAPGQALHHQPARGGGRHRSFATALRAALRQDPDVILVGEMRDSRPSRRPSTPPRPGHLVFATLHTLDATETINRVISVFPPHQQKQIRIQLSQVLKAVICQRLVPRADGQGRVPAVEVLIATETRQGLHRGQGEDQGDAGRHRPGHLPYGMQTFDQSLYFLLQEGLITVEEALKRATNVGEFKLRLEGIASTGEMSRSNMDRGMSISSGLGREAGGAPPAPPNLNPAKAQPRQDQPPGDIKITLAR